jgi:hypothetical protein
MMVRQGDILLVEADAVPMGARRLERVGGNVVIADGEVTGHKHQIRSNDVDMFEFGTQRWLEVRAPAALVHEEHATIELRTGIYTIVRQREYVPGVRARHVED